jgi:hypothetical protein
MQKAHKHNAYGLYCGPEGKSELNTILKRNLQKNNIKGVYLSIVLISIVLNKGIY